MNNSSLLAKLFPEIVVGSVAVETEYELNNMISFIHEGVACAVLDANGNYTKVNPAFCRMTGYNENEL